LDQVVVLGVGNTLLTDEGAGVHAARYFSNQFGHLEKVRVLDGGTLSFTLSEHIDDADLLIVFDAARLGGSPGNTDFFVDDDMDRFLGSGRCSVHEVGLMDLLGMSHLRGCLPRHRVLVGIEPDVIDWGEELTPAVKESIPVMVEQALDLLRQWDENFEQRPHVQVPADTRNRPQDRKIGMVTV